MALACQQQVFLSSSNSLFPDVSENRDSAGSRVLPSHHSETESRLYSMLQISAVFCVALHVHQHKRVLLVVLDDFRDGPEALKKVKKQGEISLNAENNAVQKTPMHLGFFEKN